ncbi:MAG: YHYH domain-containing protein [Alphaproteobacteria bacterium]|nr:YHYH domain-containing protein [Alphaproteobacteria bacterium]
MKYISLIFVIFFMITSIGFSHSGNTDSNGCHTNKKTGQYHCHGKKR